MPAAPAPTMQTSASTREPLGTVRASTNICELLIFAQRGSEGARVRSEPRHMLRRRPRRHELSLTPCETSRRVFIPGQQSFAGPASSREIGEQLLASAARKLRRTSMLSSAHPSRPVGCSVGVPVTPRPSQAACPSGFGVALRCSSPWRACPIRRYRRRRPQCPLIGIVSSISFSNGREDSRGYAWESSGTTASSCTSWLARRQGPVQADRPRRRLGGDPARAHDGRLHAVLRARGRFASGRRARIRSSRSRRSSRGRSSPTPSQPRATAWSRTRSWSRRSTSRALSSPIAADPRRRSSTSCSRSSCWSG